MSTIFEYIIFDDDCVIYISGLPVNFNPSVSWTNNTYPSLDTTKTKAMVFGNRQKLIKCMIQDQ